MTSDSRTQPRIQSHVAKTWAEGIWGPCRFLKPSDVVPSALISTTDVTLSLGIAAPLNHIRQGGFDGLRWPFHRDTAGQGRIAGVEGTGEANEHRGGSEMRNCRWNPELAFFGGSGPRATSEGTTARDSWLRPRGRHLLAVGYLYRGKPDGNATVG